MEIRTRYSVGDSVYIRLKDGVIKKAKVYVVKTNTSHDMQIIQYGVEIGKTFVGTRFEEHCFKTRKEAEEVYPK